MKKKIVSVSDVNRYVARLLEEDYVLSDVWVSGEVSNCKYHQSGHIYFTLKDEKSSVSAVMFSKDALKLEFQIEEGQKIYCRCRLSLYERTGSYQAYVTEIEQQGKGTLYEAYEKLKKKLYNEGLFDDYKKQPIPTLPKAVGVVTSHTGAAIKDIIEVARRRNPNIPIYIYPAHVQGPLAPNELIEALRKIEEDNIVDVIIIGRGGGSIEDLWAFNDETLARTISQMNIPIVSAVGHEVDFTISDFVSDRRAATPSQAAEIVFPSIEVLEERIINAKKQLEYVTMQFLKNQKNQFQMLIDRPVYKYKQRYFEDKMILVDNKVNQIEDKYKKVLMTHRQKLTGAALKLDALSPLKTLSRGYGIATIGDDENLLKTSKDVEIGDTFKLTLQSGYIIGKVEEKG
ncbi:MAG: exodeoxyribonuclease VII large subunit [Cellulosilyticaceae bacterium]